jgi:hypothetical protein
MPTVGTAFQFLEREWAPARAPVDSVLYVGHRADTHPWWATDFRHALGGPSLAVLDLVPACADSASRHTSDLLVGDVRSPGSLRGRVFGLVFWDEGPEHVPRGDALACLSRLMSEHRHVLVSCPWGHQPQGSSPSDPEFHHWAPDPSDFESIGMATRCFGTRFSAGGVGHGNLIAWSPA